MTAALITLALVAAALWWLWRGLRECGDCLRELSEFHHPNLGDTDDR